MEEIRTILNEDFDFQYRVEPKLTAVLEYSSFRGSDGEKNGQFSNWKTNFKANTFWCDSSMAEVKSKNLKTKSFFIALWQKLLFSGLYSLYIEVQVQETNSKTYLCKNCHE